MWSLRGGLTMRAWVVLLVLLFSARIWRPPTIPGWQRWAVWIAAWAIPAGYAMAAAFPAQKKAGLHLTFIAGYALMALAVGLHVTLAHSGYPQMVRSYRWPVLVFGLLTLAATALRALVDFDQARFFVWLGGSAIAFLLASAIWAGIALPRMWSRDSETG